MESYLLLSSQLNFKLDGLVVKTARGYFLKFSGVLYTGEIFSFPIYLLFCFFVFPLRG